MEMDAHHSINLKIVLILTMGFASASLLGYLAQRLRLSPILGYLIAGYAIGPFSPGFVADLQLAEQLAEVGVMLMMFGVGLHFKWQDLVKVKSIAIPGALGQTFIAAASSALLVHALGGSWQIGLMIGLAIGVASTVVLVRELSDHKLLTTLEGHIAVGWLIVEDVLTVSVLILLPTIAAFLAGASVAVSEIFGSMLLILIKFVLLVAIIFTVGKRFVSFVLLKIAQIKSQELFTLTILALIFVIATGSTFIFGTSIALGAFLAGMVIGQTNVRHQAAAYASPLKDTFVVIFFLSVGMLFNPSAITNNFTLFSSVLFVILVIKPLTAFLITVFLRYSVVAALTIAIALAQIGEFSFILAEEALKFNLFTDEGFDIIVACALISISLNPLLFNILDRIKPYLNKEDGEGLIQHNLDEKLKSNITSVVIGYGVIGQAVVNLLENMGYQALILERDVNVFNKLVEQKRQAVYGDASFPQMLEAAKLPSAHFLIITLPELSMNLSIIKQAKEIHPKIIIIARARHVEEQYLLMEAGAKFVCCDDEEVSLAFKQVLSRFEPPSFFD